MSFARCIGVLGLAALLAACAAIPTEVPRFSPGALSSEQRQAAGRFASGRLAERDAVVTVVWRMLPVEGLDRADWSVRLEALPYRMSTAQLYRLLGTPDRYARLNDQPSVREMYRLTRRDPDPRYFDDFAEAEYRLGCDPAPPESSKGCRLNITLWRGTVVSAMVLQGGP